MLQIKWIIQIIGKNKLKMAVSLIMFLTAVPMMLVSPIIISRLVDDVLIAKKYELLAPLALFLVGVVALRVVIKYFAGIILEGAVQNVILKLRCKLYENLTLLSQDFYRTNKTGDIMMRLTGDLDVIKHFLAFVVQNAISSAILFVISVIYFGIISLKLTLAILLLTPITAYTTLKLRKLVGPAYAKVREQVSGLNSVVSENISGNRTVKAFARKDFEIKKFEKYNTSYKEKAVFAASIWAKYGTIIEGMSFMITAVILMVGGILVSVNQMSPGQLALFLNLSFVLTESMRMVGLLVNDSQRFFASAHKVMLLYYSKPHIKNCDEPVELDNPKGKVEFCDVSLSINNIDILKNLNFVANPGETVAIMGPTGSGKTIITMLLARFIDPTSGTIMLDGTDVKHIDLTSLRAYIGSAMQDVFLFSDTIDSNIAYGCPDADYEFIKECADISDAHEFISEMPQGYDTIIGEKGVGLSGGQKQRVSLARALAFDTPVLVLDDTTSAVDMETEKYIQEKLKERNKNCTTIIIAQRISSVIDADCIYIVNNGEIAEKGTHKELLSKKGYYYEIYKFQNGEEVKHNVFTK